MNGEVERVLALLAREEELLDRVRFEVTRVVLLLAAGEQRFLSMASDDVDRAAEALAEVELLRATFLAGVAQQLGAPVGDLTVSDLAAHADRRLAGALQDQRRRLLDVIGEIDALTSSAESAAVAGLRRVREALGRRTTGALLGYGPGEPRSPSPPVRFDVRF